MALIRVPQEAQTLLTLCRKHEHGPAEQAGPPCFETYADLIVFAASYGFAEMNGRVPNRKTKFLDRPNPIDLSTFKTDKRYPQILLIAMTTSRDQNVVRDEEAICRLIEDFAAVGCGQMAVSLKSISSASAHLSLAAILIGASETTI